MGCAARSRQGSAEWVSEQRAHSIGLAAAAVLVVVRVLSSAISSTMCAASENTAAVTIRRGGGRGSSTDGSGCRWCRRARASCMRHGGQGSAGTGRRGGLCPAKGLYNQRHHLVAIFVPRVVVVAPVELDVALACLVVKGWEAAPRGGLHRLVTGAASEDLAVQPLLGVTEGH